MAAVVGSAREEGGEVGDAGESTFSRKMGPLSFPRSQVRAFVCVNRANPSERFHLLIFLRALADLIE